MSSLALALSLLAAVPLWAGEGMVYTTRRGDSPFLLQRVYEMARALADGPLPVRWMPSANLGLGYPAYNYYAALPYYLAAVLHLAGLGIIASIQVTQGSALRWAAFRPMASAEPSACDALLRWLQPASLRLPRFTWSTSMSVEIHSPSSGRWAW